MSIMALPHFGQRDSAGLLWKTDVTR